MSIEFEGENSNTHPVGNNVLVENKTGSKIGDWLIRIGLAKNANSANIFIIVGIILIFAVSIYFFIYGFALPPKKQVYSPDPLLENLLNNQEEQNY